MHLPSVHPSPLAALLLGFHNPLNVAIVGHFRPLAHTPLHLSASSFAHLLLSLSFPPATLSFFEFMSYCTAFSSPHPPAVRAFLPAALQQRWGFLARRSRIRMLSRGSPPRNRNSCSFPGAVDCPCVCVSERKDWRISQAETSTLTERTGHYPQCASGFSPPTRREGFLDRDTKRATFVILRVAFSFNLWISINFARRQRKKPILHQMSIFAFK